MPIQSNSGKRRLKLKLSPRRLRRKALVIIEKQRRAIKLKLARPKSGLHYPTGEPQAYHTFGRDFYKHFPRKTFDKNTRRLFQTIVNLGEMESECRLSLKNKFDMEIAWLSPGFEKDALIIESMQTSKNARKYLNDFRRITKGKHALDYLLEDAESTAKNRGFKFVKIRAPESLHYYKKPWLHDSQLTVEQTRRQMKILYQKIALRHGYKKQGLFYVKELN